MISIIDCGMGNLGSISNILKYIGIDSQIITSAEEINEADKLILPGVGNWDNGMHKLRESELLDALHERVIADRIPILGICLGMQLMFESSEEGDLPGLGWVSGNVSRFNFDKSADCKQKLRIPHMGWNIVSSVRKSLLTDAFNEETRFYFVHSFHVNCTNPKHKLMTCNYGYEFVCAVNRDNIWGVQFHPEKSHKFGMNLMRKFAEL